jgi:c(7)-type cytochrome triheme protein
MTPDLQKSIRFSGLLWIMLALMLLCGLLVLRAARLYAQESEFYIENLSAYQDKSRPAVYFSHENHMETYACLDCHHDFQNGQNVLEEDALEEDGEARCAACHSPKTAIGLKQAFHRQCMGCHRHVNRKEAARLPITCQGCHPRYASAP